MLKKLLAFTCLTLSISLVRKSLCIAVYIFVTGSSAFASTVRIDLVDFQNIQDGGNNGTADSIYDGFYPRYGTLTRLDYTAGTITNETLNFPIGKYSKVPFAEYDISGVNDPVSSATLNFTRFYSSPWESLGEIRVSGYAADGTVTIADFNLAAQTVGVSNPVPSTGSSQFISLDVTEFLVTQTSNFVGFRFDLNKRGGARLLDNSYNVRTEELGEGWFATTPAPYLSIETSAVSIPAATWLFGSALLGLGALKRKRV